MVATGESVEVVAGVFAECLVTRNVGMTRNPVEVFGLSGKRCEAYIAVSVERSYAPGLGSIRMVRRERAIPVAYPDSVFAYSVF